MHVRSGRLYWLIGTITALLLFSAAPVSGQGFLQRLEERVRQRLEEGPVLPPTPPRAPAVIPDLAPAAADRPRLGVEVDEVSQPGGASGVVVAVVHPDSAAAAAGLQSGDRITHFGGVPITSVSELSAVLQRSQRGDRLLMIVQREGEQVELPVRLQPDPQQDEGQAELPPPSDLPRPSSPREGSETLPPDPIAEPGLADANSGRLGMVVEDPQPTRGRRVTRGALVIEVAPGSPGAEAGLAVGDTIVAFDGTLIPDAETLITQMRRTRPGQQVELQYVRDQQLGRVKVTLASSVGGPAARNEDPTPDQLPSPRETGSRNVDDGQMPQTESQESGLDALGAVLGGLFGNANAGQGAGAGKGAVTGNSQTPAPESGEPSPTGDLPPSLDTPGSEDASPAELRETVRRLEATNRRLETRLQQLEERMEAILRAGAVEE